MRVLRPLLVVLLAAGCSSTASPRPSASPSAAPSAAPSATATAGAVPSATAAGAPRDISIGITLPLSGADLNAVSAIRDGVQMALRDFSLPGHAVGVIVHDSTDDSAVAGVAQGAKDMASLVADGSVLAVIGSSDSATAAAQIPLSNAAGLLQCSPTAADPGLTTGKGAAAMRTAQPARNSFLRLADIGTAPAAAIADFAHAKFGFKTGAVAVLDDGTAASTAAADAFSARWKALGYTARRVSLAVQADSGDFTEPLTAIAAAGAPDAVFFDGASATAAMIRKQMAPSGLGGLPLLSGSSLLDGPGGPDGTYISEAGDAAANTFAAAPVAGEAAAMAGFAVKFRDIYGDGAGAYGAAGYACAQVVLASLRAAAALGGLTRESVRAAATDPATLFDTVIGPIRFDAAGDVVPQTVSFWMTDLTVAPAGDWVFSSQQAGAPAP
jgi:branched-chain amino acid transport system substrate-binding protein